MVDAILTADVAIGCTDSHHSRLAMSDLAFRYLLPSMGSGVCLEGSGGRVTGQIGQLVRMLAMDPCALCRELVDARAMAQEMMSADERSFDPDCFQRLATTPPRQ